MAKSKASSMQNFGVKNPAVITDGCNPELVKGADFDGIFEIPIIKAPEILAIPKAMVPFSKRDKVTPSHFASLGDKTRITFRTYPKTEGSPSVEIKLTYENLRQKIHFIKR